MLIVFSFLILLILSFYLYENRSIKYKVLTSLEKEAYTKVLSKNALTPIDYVLKKFETNEIVVIGEAHRVSQDYKFLKNLLKPLATSGIHYVGIEFYEKNYQNKINKFLKNKTFEPELLREIILSDNYFFFYQELYEVFEEAWKLNNKGLEINIIALEPQKKHISHKDYIMAAIADEIVKKGHKILLYTGEHHAFTKYIQPEIGDLIFSKKPTLAFRMGNLLISSEFKRKAFHISLHYVSFKKYWPFIPFGLYKKGLCLRFDGVLDQVLNNYGKPVGFDTKLPLFEKIEDTRSYYSYGYKPLYFKDYTDGYIFFNPLKDNNFVSPLKDICKSNKDLEYLKSFNHKKLEIFDNNTSAENFLKKEGLNKEYTQKILDYGNLEF